MVRMDNLVRIGENMFDLPANAGEFIWISVGNIAIQITVQEDGATVESHPLGQGTDPSLSLGALELYFQDAAQVIEQANAQITMMEQIDPLYFVNESIYQRAPITLSKEDPHFAEKHARVKAAGYSWDKANNQWRPPLAKAA